MEILRREIIFKLCENPQNFRNLSVVLRPNPSPPSLSHIVDRFATYIVRSARELLKAADGVALLTIRLNLQHGGPRQVGAVRHTYSDLDHSPSTELQLVDSPMI